jgi:signal transduction histidine kinase
MRLVLAATALLIIFIDPLQPDRLVTLTYSLLFAYTAYSALLLIVAFLAPHLLPARILHWLDLIWYVALISTSSGTSSIFFLFFFFPMLVASFRWGFLSGLRVTLGSAILFVTVAYATAPQNPDFELNRFLLRLAMLLALGYMIAHWGGSEIESKRRLNLLNDVNNLSNPRFGVERTIRLGLARLRVFCDARAAVLVTRGSADQTYKLTRVSESKDDLPPEELTDDAARLLLSPTFDLAVVRAKPSGKALLYNVDTGHSATQTLAVVERIAASLGAKSFTSVPVMYGGYFAGRLYLIETRRQLGVKDVEFLLQVLGHVTPLLDNIRLLDHMASDAAEQERKKLARDIHDSVIQPYVGLQLGLAAVRQKLLSENSAAFDDVNELCEVASEEVRRLRHFLDELKTEDVRHTVIFPAVRRFAAKYSAATRISVGVTGEEQLQLNDRLAAEIFQMITEALSNVRRHTLAQNADIEIFSDDNDVIVNIINDSSNGATLPAFRPRSVTERVSALGGQVKVYADKNNRTVVGIRIPL